MNTKTKEWELECRLRERMRKLKNYEVIALLGSDDENERYVAAKEKIKLISVADLHKAIIRQRDAQQESPLG